jgi:predicted RNase H-like HicB family nuclease
LGNDLIAASDRHHEREEDGFVAHCPELDIASERATIEEARHNSIEALTLFFETADPAEELRCESNIN